MVSGLRRLVVAKPELALLFAPLLIIVTVGLMGLVPLILFENKDVQKKRKQVERKETGLLLRNLI